MKKKLVILSGAGISAESNIATFRDTKDGSGLWENFDIMEVCSAEAWDKNPTKVNDFYNTRRIEVLNAVPNRAHIALAEAEEYFDIQILTTNVDDLHERAGSSNVLHIHGEILKARSSNPCYNWAGISPDSKINNYKTYPVGRKGLTMNDLADDGFPLRPDIVFFQESVPNLSKASDIIKEADIFVVVGTSLSVYPAANLVWDTKPTCRSYCVNPDETQEEAGFPCVVIPYRATIGIPNLLKTLLSNGNV